MSFQSEKELEQKLINLLSNKHKYEFVKIDTLDGLKNNFREQLNELNSDNLKENKLSDKEFERVMIYLEGKSVFQSAKQLRDKFELQRDNGEFIYIKFINLKDVEQNKYQVTNQIAVFGKYENRYDITILINGLPIVQIELKRRGLNIKEAFNQCERYRKHSYFSLFKYIQIFVISNGVDTKYFSNSDSKYKFEQTFFWTDESNKRISSIHDFTNTFLNQKHLTEMIDTYMVLNDSDKILMIMRPYQVYAVKGVVKRALETINGGYCFHATGSGKTLTSFKISQILSNEPSVKKVIFVVDRNDLDSQTIQEFNKFEKGSVDTTNNTHTFVKQMNDISNVLIITTIQKLSNAVKNDKYKHVMEQYKDEKIIFIIDECHRTQFGEMHKRIREFFNNAQFFGFTGTPRFKENKSQDEKTTADVFGKCIHTYMIKDAIFDNNVLGFSVEYIKTFDNQYEEKDGQRVYDIDTKEVYESDERISMVANHIALIHDTKTYNRKYTAIFATPNIPMLLKYYNEFKKINHDLNIAAIFTYQQNEESESRDEHSRDSLENIIKDYNNMFCTNFNTSTFEGYRLDISKRVKAGQIDILLVVNMFLTGFDSKLLNTLYVDKPLKYHDLLQAFSRTNRTYDATKLWGNVVCYRNLKPETDAAIRLFNDDSDVDTVIQKSFEVYRCAFKSQLDDMFKIAKKPSDVDELKEESKQKDFIIAFRNMASLLVKLKSFIGFEFTEDVLGIDEQDYEDFKSKYLLLYDKHIDLLKAEKTSILDDIDFCIDTIRTDRVNVEYIMNLIKSINRDSEEATNKDIVRIITELNRTDNPVLKKKSELIKAFLDKEFRGLSKEQSVDDAYNEFEQKERSKEILSFAKENEIDFNLLSEFISEYEFTSNVDIETIGSNIKKPYLQKRKIVNKIIDFIKENVFKYQ